MLALAICIGIIIALVVAIVGETYGKQILASMRKKPKPKTLEQVLKEVLVGNPKGTFFVFERKDEHSAVLKLENIEGLLISKEVEIRELSAPYFVENNMKYLALDLIRQYKKETTQTNLPWGVYGNDVD